MEKTMTQQIIVSLLIVFATWFLLRLTFRGSRIIKKKIAQQGSLLVNEQVVNYTERFAAILIIVAALLLILPIYGLNINGLLAIGGIGGILIGFTIKDVLTNILGAFTVYIDNLFLIGDTIALPEKNVQGTVEAIRWRQTIVRTHDKRAIFIPNAYFVNNILENLSRKKYYHFEETIPLDLMEPAQFRQMIEVIEVYLQQHLDVVKEEKASAYLSSVTDGVFALVVNIYLQNDDEKVKQEIILEVLKIASSYGGRLKLKSSIN
jgi:MscS family membrane protein